MEKISALVTTREGFTFSTPNIDVKLNQGFDESGNPYNTIRLKEVDGLIAFHYRDKLLRIDDTLSENDILTKFLSSGKNEQSLIKFLDEYGFLYRSSSDKYALYSCNELLRVINQVHRLVELIMEISKDTPALNIIAESLVQMMLSYPVKVHDLTKEGNPKILYEAPEHPIRKYLTDTGALSINTNFTMMIDEDPSSDYLYFVDEAFYTDHNYQLGINLH